MSKKKFNSLITKKIDGNLDELFSLEEEVEEKGEEFFIKEIEKNQEENTNTSLILSSNDNDEEHSALNESADDKNNLSLYNKNSDLTKYIKNVFSIPNLTNEEEAKLMEKYFKTKDIESGQKIIASHLKLVVKLGFKYRKYTNSLVDLFSEGNLGLMHALKKFKPFKGIKFATYATFWIRSYIQDYIIKTWSSIKNKSKDLKKKLFSKIEDKDNIKIEKEISLERSLYDDENQVYQIEESENFVENFLEKDKEKLKQKIIKDAVLKLDERAVFILQERFFKEKKMTLGELSEKLKISKERIRQIEEKSVDFIKKYIQENYKIENLHL